MLIEHKSNVRKTFRKRSGDLLPNVRETFRKHSGSLLNILCTLSVYPVCKDNGFVKKLS